MMALTIRRARSEDASDLACLLELFDGNGATPEQVVTRLLACQRVVPTLNVV